MWLTAFAAIGRGAKKFAVRRDVNSIVPLRGHILGLVVPLAVSIPLLASLGVFSSSTSQSTKGEIEPSYVDFLMGPSWINFMGAYNGVYFGTHRLLNLHIMLLNSLLHYHQEAS